MVRECGDRFDISDVACELARSRAFKVRKRAVIDGNWPDQHWDRVRRIIGHKTGRDQLDVATRYLTRE